MDAIRNPYIVTKALNSNLRGSVIIAISGHLITTIDAVVVSWYLGQKALSAVNIVIPVLTLFSSLMIMLGVGASVSISKALGQRIPQEVNLSSSSSIVGSLITGIVAALVTYRFSLPITKILVHGDVSLFQYAHVYLKTFCFAVVFLIPSGVIGAIVRTDGNTRLISVASWVGVILNLVLDIIFIGYLKTGIAGAAWSTAIIYFLILLISLLHFLSADNTIRWSPDIKKYFIRLIKNCKLGFSTSMTDLLLAISLFIINGLMLRYQGNEGIYCWAVCYQIFLILQMLISGLDSSIFAVGGTLVGEDDVTGFYYLYRRCAVYMIVSVVILSLVIILFPGIFGTLFGNRGDDHLGLLPSVLKIFSLFLFPYAMILQVRSVYTILGRSFLSLFLCFATFGLMILFILFSSILRINPVWWSFPVSAWVLLVFLIIFTVILHVKNKNLRIFSLIPKSVDDPSFNVSVGITKETLDKVETGMNDFLKSNNLSLAEINYTVDITGKIMEDILKELSEDKNTGRYFDINVRLKNGHPIVILKDDGGRLHGEKEREFLSEITRTENVASNPAPDTKPPFDLTTKYFYLNDQNIFTLNFERRN